MLFLMQIAPQIPEFWIAAAMCDKKMGQYQMAIDLYKYAQTIFPENPSLYLYCADNYLSLGDTFNAKIELETFKKILNSSPNDCVQWQPTYEYLIGKAA